MKLKTILILVCFLIAIPIFSQKRLQPTPEEISLAKKLKEKFDKDDPVALLHSKEVITFGYDKKSDKVTVTNKITEKYISLDDRADISLYRFYDGQTSIKDFEAHYKNKRRVLVYFKDEAYNSDGLFHNDSRVMHTNIDFPLKGYKYTVTLTENIKDIKYFTQLYFTGDYPIVKKEIVVVVPNWLELELKEMNFEGFDISKNVQSDAKKQTKTYTFIAKNIPARYKESNAPGPTYTYPHILFLSKSYTQNGTKKPLFKETQDLYNWYKSLVNQLKNDNSVFKDKVAELTKNASTDDEKIKNIFYWVQDNIRYIAFEDGIAGFKPDEASNVYKKKYGDCKGMANLTKQMLKEAGFDSRLVWIGTKRIAYDYSLPNLSVDNHMICALVKKDGKIIFLDGTEKYNPLGEYANRIQEKEALIENGDTFILKKVPKAIPNFNTEKMNYNFALKGEDLVGTVSKSYSGESRTYLLNILNNLKKDEKDEALKNYLNKDDINLKVSNIKISNIENRDVDLKIDYDITVKNAVSSFDDEVYITIDLDKELKTLELKDRNLDFIFSSKKNLESTTSLHIPDTYTISSVPNNLDVDTKNYKLSLHFEQKGNTIIYKKNFTIKNAKIEKSDFENWNASVNKLKKIYSEQIILNKK